MKNIYGCDVTTKKVVLLENYIILLPGFREFFDGAILFIHMAHVVATVVSEVNLTYLSISLLTTCSASTYVRFNVI